MLKTLGSAGDFLSKMGESLIVDENRCVRMRHKLSSCSLCEDACPVDAISIGAVGTGVVVDWQTCTECGICSSICPTGVFDLKGFNEKTLLNMAVEKAGPGGKLEIFCQEAKEEKKDNALAVHCLGVLQSSHLIYLVSRGIQQIHFKHADCDGCKLKGGDQSLKKHFQETGNLAESFEKEISLSSGEESASFLMESNIKKKQISASKAGENIDRRGLFRFWKDKSKQTAVKTVAGVIASEESTAKKRIQYSALLPLKRKVLLKALRNMEEPVNRFLPFEDSAQLADILIDDGKCSHCGICYRFCPTGALEYFQAPGKPDGTVYEGIGFLSDHCVRCDLCLISCLEGAISYTDSIDLKRLQSGKEKLLTIRTAGLVEDPFERRVGKVYHPENG